VDTRIRKAQNGNYDAIILAEAGIKRLGLEYVITQRLPFEIMLPAPGQGALAVQCRAADEQTLQILHTIDHTDTRKAVEAERTFLEILGGGCSLPVGAYATIVGGQVQLHATVASPDGTETIRLSGKNPNPSELGRDLAQEALIQGAGRLIQ
jgi:hydroxymethylbilane synthase